MGISLRQISILGQYDLLHWLYQIICVDCIFWYRITAFHIMLSLCADLTTPYHILWYPFTLIGLYCIVLYLFCL